MRKLLVTVYALGLTSYDRYESDFHSFILDFDGPIKTNEDVEMLYKKTEKEFYDKMKRSCNYERYKYLNFIAFSILK